MDNNIIFSFPGNKKVARQLAKRLQIEEGELVVTRFPDGESYVRINSTVKNKVAILVCTLNNPDRKILSLMFAARTLKELGAKKIILIAPYLPYMRQDKRFKPGEAVSAPIFAQFVSTWVDNLITIDPHLHRIHHLSQIYSVPVLTLHAMKEITQWIKDNIKSPFLIGPDSESEQWVSEIAKQLNAPYIVCRKNRLSAHEVTIDIPPFSITNDTLILMDDIISTGSSMETILKRLSLQGHKGICLVVHPLCNAKTKARLMASGAEAIISCNTISDVTNTIDVSELIATHLETIIEVNT